jgi:preprotein translocase SecE subunit
MVENLTANEAESRSKWFNLQEFKFELSQIEWSSRQEVLRLTGHVLVIMFIFSGFVLGIDIEIIA